MNVAIEAALEPRLEALFRQDAQLCYEVLDRLRAEAGIAECDLTLVVADDFASSVQKHMREPDEAPFQVERPTGRVAAKNLAQDDEGRAVVIVFDARGWAGWSSETGAERFSALGLIGHELAHPILTRARHASGALEGVIRSSHTPTEISRALARILADEYRADVISDLILDAAATKTIDGVTTPATTWDAHADSYMSGLRDLVNHVHPGMAEIVQAHREGHLGLVEMWRRIVFELEHLLTMVIHARAHADSVGDIPVLSSEGLRDHPSVKLYLADTLPAFFEVLRKRPALPAAALWLEMERETVSVGEPMIREIWRRLGLTFTEAEGTRRYVIHVDAPLR